MYYLIRNTFWVENVEFLVTQVVDLIPFHAELGESSPFNWDDLRPSPFHSNQVD